MTGLGSWSGCSGGRKRFVVPLGSICTYGGCVCASAGDLAKVSPSLGWSWWSLVGALQLNRQPFGEVG